MTRGIFITLEGGEGSGKSTHIPALADFLTSTGKSLITTREPGGSPGAEHIRGVLVKGDVDRWDAITEALLLSACRRDHIRTTIQPALDQGKWVLCDRFADSTIAYQGYGYGVPLEELKRLYALISEGLKPDLTILLDISPEVGLKRALSRKDQENRYERMDIAFHQRIREGYLEMAAAEPDRFVRVDAAQSIDVVKECVIDVIKNRLITA